jgi:hypothetical protein
MARPAAPKRENVRFAIKWDKKLTGIRTNVARSSTKRSPTKAKARGEDMVDISEWALKACRRNLLSRGVCHYHYLMEELHIDSIDGGHEANYGARSRARERACSNTI